MAKQKSTLLVKGMQCSACEMKIEKNLKKEAGIYKVRANRTKDNVFVEWDNEKISIERIYKVIRDAGYEVRGVLAQEKSSLNISGYLFSAIIFGIIAFVFILQQRFSVHFIPVITPEMGYSMLFVVGLLTSLHCVGMCGGINLSQSLSKNPEKQRQFLPSLKYNTGRLVSYTLIGGVLGGIGKLLSLTPFSKGLIFIIAGIFMLFVGMNLLGVLSFSSFISKFFSKIYDRIDPKGKKLSPFVVGLLNGFMPCGPLQGMQIYALTTGSFIIGAMSMFIFALGTFPLMFFLGALTTFLSKKFAGSMMKLSGVIVIFLSLTMFSNGLTLTGNPLLKRNEKNFNVAELKENFQVITTEIEPNRYPPIVVQKGMPVRWIIKARAENLNSCNNAIVIPAYNIEKKLQVGENIIEFTPTNEGNIYYSCWMGMISSTIKVVKDIRQSSVITESEILQFGKNQGSCCAVGNSERYTGGKLPLDNIGIAKIREGIQEVIIDVDENGYTPSVVVLQRNIQAKIKFNPKRLTSCNYVVIFPEYRGKLDLSVGQWETPLIGISVDFTFTCGMNMLHGYAKVVDDLKKVNLEKIKKELENYRFQTSGGCCGL